MSDSSRSAEIRNIEAEAAVHTAYAGIVKEDAAAVALPAPEIGEAVYVMAEIRGHPGLVAPVKPGKTAHLARSQQDMEAPAASSAHEARVVLLSRYVYSGMVLHVASGLSSGRHAGLPRAAGAAMHAMAMPGRRRHARRTPYIPGSILSKPVYGRRTSGTIMLPSACWKFSIIAHTTRSVTPVAEIVCTNPLAPVFSSL